jgi:hypothetical protein
MNNLKTNITGKASQGNIRTNASIDTFIQPYKEKPSKNISEQKNESQINPHDLFLFFTADIIKEDIVFTR